MITITDTCIMEFTKFTKRELLVKCHEVGITNGNSKNKEELIHLLHLKSANIGYSVSTTNISPLRYPGGKTRACKIIDNVIMQHFDIQCFDTIMSPFFGGGSFEFYSQNKYGLKLIVNDKFTPLYNFWKQVKINKNIL